MNRELVTAAERFLKDRFSASDWMKEHPEERNYRLEHSYRVANIGKQIALREGFDETEMVIACLLHDVSYCEVFGEGGWREHGRRSAAIARPFLRELGLAEERIAAMCYGIAIHVDDEADFAGERTPFAMSVGDADNIDRLDVYRIHETLSREGFLEMSCGEKIDSVRKRLERLRGFADLPTGTETAQDLWEQRLGFCISFYERLADQLECSGGLRC